MSESLPGAPEATEALLARSLFGFALLAWLPLPLVWILILLSPPSPAAAYESLRHAIALGAGIAGAAGLLLTALAYRCDEAASRRVARLLIRLFGHPWRALLFALALLEANILALLALRDIAPSIVTPFRLLLFFWSLVFAALLLTANWRRAADAFRRRRDFLALTGICLAAIALCGLLLITTSRLLDDMRLNARIRGSLDYRELEFVDDGAAPETSAYLEEQSQMLARWLPYSYWTMSPFAGAYIHVDERGIRHTPVFTNAADAPRVYFFGGSTMWGEGARDAYTIPAWSAKLLAESDKPAIVKNYAQSGYVSWQDLLLFQAQLANGDAPDVAVFYHGFNDVYAAFLQGSAGLTLQEMQRASDVEMGRLLRRGQPILAPFAADAAAYDWSLVASDSNSPAEIAARWRANHRLIRAAATEYGTRVLFVWQPAIFAKTALSPSEAQIAQKLERERTGFSALYQAVDRELRQADDMGDVLFLTELFADEAANVFIDMVHIAETGNLTVASAIAPAIASLLAED